MAHKSQAEYLRRAEELIEKERAYEAAMDQRIITESALIRSEWCDVVRASRWVQKKKPLEIVVARRTSGSPHGGEFE